MSDTPTHDLRPIRPGPFVAALLLAPLLVAAPFLGLGFLADKAGADLGGLHFLVMIPILALAFGCAPYLAFGTPAFIWALHRRRSTVSAALLAVLASAPVLLAIMVFRASDVEAPASIIVYLVFGCLFASIWGAVFGHLYHRFAGEPFDV